jgi:hypothetical protein
MRTSTILITAGQTIRMDFGGDYFHLLETTAGVDIDFLKNNSVQSTASNMEFGFFSQPKEGFDGIALTSATTQTVKIAVGYGAGGYNRTMGSVQITGQQGAFSAIAHAVSSTATTLIAANPYRKYLLIQNQDAAVTVGVSIGAGAYINLAPGDSYELAAYCTSDSIGIDALPYGGAGAAVVVVEG